MPNNLDVVEDAWGFAISRNRAVMASVTAPITTTLTRCRMVDTLFLRNDDGPRQACRAICYIDGSRERSFLLRANCTFRRAILLALFAGCGDPAGVSEHSSAGIERFIVSNQLAAPVTIAVDDTVELSLISGASSGLAVSPAAQWLTWTSAKPTDSTGTPILDDIGEVRLRVSGIRSALEITNVINDTTYVTAGVFNPTNARVSIGVYDGSTVACAGVLRGTTGGVVGFTKIGYYRLLPGTEIRAYRDEFRCTGPYVAWPASQLTQFTPKSGLITLTLTSAP